MTELPKIPTPPDSSVQNLEESFNDYATERSTPNTDSTSIPSNQKPEAPVHEQIITEAIDMQITSSLGTSGQKYIEERIKTSITQHIDSEEMQDNIRDVTNQHMKQFLDIEGSLQEQQKTLSTNLKELQEQISEGTSQLANLKEQMSEGFCLLAELKNTNQDIQDQNVRLQATLQETKMDITQASRKHLQTVEEQTEMLTTRGLARAEKQTQAALRQATKAVSDKHKAKLNSQLTLYDKTMSDKYEEQLAKGTDLLYEMGNTIKTELDLVLEESSENIANLKSSAAMESIIAHARKTIENSWKPAQERQTKTILTIRASQTKLETTVRNHEIQLQRELNVPENSAIKSLEERLDNLEDGNLYPTSLDMDTQIQSHLEEGLRTIKTTVQMHMEEHINNTVDAIYRKTHLPELTIAKAKIDANMDHLLAHINSNDEVIIQIRKTIADHVESLVDKLHEQYMNPTNPFMNPESYNHEESTNHTQMGAQPPQTPRPQHREHPASPTVTQTRMNDTRVELGLHNYKRDMWSHRLSNDPTRQEMEQFYDIIVNSSRAYNVPILKRDELKPRGTVYPQPKLVSGECHDRISMIIYSKLLETIPGECDNMHSILGSFSSRQDGYSALFAIMRTKCTYLQDIQPLWGPLWTPTMSPYSYLTSLNSTLEEERRRYHNRTNFDIAAEILQQASQHEEYKLLATAYLTTLLPLVSQSKHQTLPKEYQKENLINALSSYHRKPIAGGTGAGAFQINRFGAPPHGKPPRKEFKYKNEIQCTACKTFGHDIKLNVCRFSAQHHHAMKFATKFPEETIKNASAYASAQDKAKVTKAKATFPNLFHPDMTEDDEMDALAHIAMMMYPDRQED
jgi:hypothetical protein